MAGRLSRIHGNHLRIAKSMLWVTGFVLIAKGVALAKEMAVAWKYGIGAEVDAYLLALTVTTWVPMTIGSVGTYVLVPHLIASKGNGQSDRRFLAELNGAALLATLLVTLLVSVLAPVVTGAIAEGLSNEAQRLAVGLTWQLALVAPLTLICGYFAIRLQAEERFRYTLLEALPALGILVLVLAVPASSGTAPLVVGTLIGLVAQALWSARMTVAAGAGQLAFGFKAPEWKYVLAGLGGMAASQVVLGLSGPIDQVFAAQIGDRAIATLGYANRILTLLTGLGILVIGRAILPVLSSVAAEGKLDLGRYQTNRWALLLLVAGALASAVGWLLAPWGVGLVFERGAFSSADSESVSSVVQLGLVQVPFLLAGMVLMQWLAVQRRYGALLLATIAALAAKLLFNVILVKTHGVGGIALSTGMMFATWTAAQWVTVEGGRK